MRSPGVTRRPPSRSPTVPPARSATRLPSGREPLAADEGRVHSLVIEFEDLQWASADDGTLVEGGTAIRISYRDWTVDGDAAADTAAALAERWQAQWPNAWVAL